MAVVVSDTSPLRCFHHLGRLDLLAMLFGEVFVPPAVSAELSKPRPRFPPIETSAIPFVRVRDDTSPVGFSNPRWSASIRGCVLLPPGTTAASEIGPRF